MFLIAICDDDIKICEKISYYIEKFGEKEFVDFMIDIYYSGEHLCDAISNGKSYDMVFLDIELNGKNGVEVGRFLREEKHNNEIDIVYISFHRQYAMELFKIRPLDFLVKPVVKKDIERVLNTAIELSKNRLRTFEYRVKRETRKVYIKDILYFKGKDREVEMVTSYSTICFYEKLENIFSNLKESGFFFAHKSFLVNPKRVSQFYYDRLVMDNGVELAIAQARRAEIRKMQIRI